MFGSQAQSEESDVSEYHLCWNNYQASLASFLKLLSQAKDGEQLLTDVTISCTEGRLFQAHRLVLATCSTYFRSLFLGKGLSGGSGLGGACQIHPIVYIPDMSGQVMEQLLAFMYRGEITVPTSDLVPLIEAAKLLGVQGLTDPQEAMEEKHGAHGEDEAKELLTSQIEDQETGEENEDCQQQNYIKYDLQSSGSIKLEDDIAMQEEEVKKEIQQPDSSENTTIYRPRHVEMDPPENISSAASTTEPDQFPSYSTLAPLPSPLALSLAATKHFSLGFGLDQQMALPPAVGRRKSTSNRNSRSPRITSSQPLANSPQILYPNVYPPTEDPSRPFACSICPKRFRMKHHLKEHNLIHSGEMPFSCHLCPKRFNRSYTLKNHMKLHSNGVIPDQKHQTESSISNGLGGGGLIVPMMPQNYSLMID